MGLPIPQEAQAELKDNFLDKSKIYIGCTQHWAKKFNSSKEDPFVIAFAVLSKCSQEKMEARNAAKAMLFGSRPNNALPIAKYDRGADDLADQLEDGAKRDIVALIVQKRIK